MYFIYFILLLYSTVGYSQVNIESSRLQIFSEDGLHTTSEVGWELKKGNTNVTEVRMGLRLDFVNGKNHTFLSGKYDYGYSNEATFKNSTYAHLRHTYMFGEVVGAEGFLQSQSSEFNALKLRQLVGSGARIEKKADSFVFAIGVGGMLEYENLTYEIEDQDFLVFRSTNYLSIRHKLAKRSPLQMYTIAYYQPLFSNVDDYRILVDSGLEYSISKYFILTNSFNVLYDANPPINVGGFDLANTLKIKSQF